MDLHMRRMGAVMGGVVSCCVVLCCVVYVLCWVVGRIVLRCVVLYCGVRIRVEVGVIISARVICCDSPTPTATVTFPL